MLAKSMFGGPLEKLGGQKLGVGGAFLAENPMDGALPDIVPLMVDRLVGHKPAVEKALAEVEGLSAEGSLTRTSLKD